MDRFEVIAYYEIDPSGSIDAGLLDKPLIGPKLVVGLLPEDPNRRQQLMDEVLFQGRPDLDRRPEFWHPYDEQRAYVVNRAKDLNDLLARDEETALTVRRVLDRLQREVHELRYVPLTGRQQSFTYLIDAVTGEPVELIDVDPWGAAGRERSSGVPVEESGTEQG